MTRYQVLKRICMVIAILLSDGMCAVVGYEYALFNGEAGMESVAPHQAWPFSMRFRLQWESSFV